MQKLPVPQMRSSRMAPILMAAYRWPPFRPGIRWLIGRLEGGIMCSVTQRRIFEVYEGVRIGPYSCGAGIRPGLFARGTVIGNFSCFAIGLQVLRRNQRRHASRNIPFSLIPCLGSSPRMPAPMLIPII